MCVSFANGFGEQPMEQPDLWGGRGGEKSELPDFIDYTIIRSWIRPFVAVWPGPVEKPGRVHGAGD